MPAFPAPRFAPRCLCLDIETALTNARDIREIAAWRADTGESVVLGPEDLKQGASSLARLDALTEGAAFVLGHNLCRHDLPALAARFPELAMHRLPAVDTLILSPIAFPANPYHALIKDYKLVRDSRNDPLKDAQLAMRLWQDQYAALQALNASSPEEVACYHFFLTRGRQGGLGSFFSLLRKALAPDADTVARLLPVLTQGKICPHALADLLPQLLADEADGHAFAYVLAWLRVSGGNSVLPPWVSLQYPETGDYQRRLRETPCADPGCPYCSVHLDPCCELERYFGYRSFRPEPTTPEGHSLQEAIVRAGYAGRSLLAILPTGGGKSLCYQLPALSRHWQSGALTVIVSPLQSLMKDQVDNLVRAGVFSAATLNGLLNMPERRAVLDKIRLGDIGLLLVSPEQFRNRGFVEAIRHRRIGAWIFDEAHCLSKWGNDFRPDYLYVSRFIRERQQRTGERAPPIGCFTATAKQEVIDDIRSHFEENLGVSLHIFDGGHARDNLHYEVMAVRSPEKRGVIHRLLEHEFGAPQSAPRPGGAVVFASRRKITEDLAVFLKDMGWACAHFHAGLDPGLKKEIQQAFIQGDLKVIVATNAFGMGVDKSDVRLVVHADIPGSLENYLQEAGRAGRDRQESRCVLLYDEEDVEAQFSLAAHSRLSRQDIAGILRALRRHASRTGNAEVVLTPGEILAEQAPDSSLERDQPDADTKVKTAIAWLERARMLERNENHIRLYPASLKVASLDDASRRLAGLDLPEALHRAARELIGHLINARDDEGISTDELMSALGLASRDVIDLLHRLEKGGLLNNDLSLSVLLRKGVKDASTDRLQRLETLEKAVLTLLPELAPDADQGDWQDINLRGLCQELKDRSNQTLLPEQLLTLLHSLARPFGDGDHRHLRPAFDIRLLRREILKVRVQRPWSAIRDLADKRRKVAAVLLRECLARLDDKLRGVDLRVSCKIGDLAHALRHDMEVGPLLKDEILAIDAGLLYLHDNGALILDRGKSVFRSAMTIRIFPEEKRGFTNADFEPLKAHYHERNFQIHVIQEYARLGLRKLSDALNFVLAYFTLPKLDFIRRYFAGRREILDRATTEEAYRTIVDSLRHPLQQRLVSEKPENNRLVLAGPGSGKTRVIVHRVAYLVRVLREPASSIIVLTFNRGAAWEIRQRLRNLLPTEAGAVTILTYHALALRLTGSSLAGLSEARDTSPDLDALLDQAIALLQGQSQIPGLDGEADALRERLLAGYRHILVDEYQDIDQRQYTLISALAGRHTGDKDARLTLLAVGDDDQNIYTFRGSSNRFIQHFQEDYQAKVDYLVENYRATANLIRVANGLIAPHRQRLKADHPIRINTARQHDPAGGRWQNLDPVGQGRVQVANVPPCTLAQAAIVMAECTRLKALDPLADWSDFAILAHNRSTLEPIRAWCYTHHVPFRLGDRDQAAPRFHQTREAAWLLDPLRRKPGRRLRPGCLPRWFRLRFTAAPPDDPWLALLHQFVQDIDQTWDDLPVPARNVIESLYEFATDATRQDNGHLILSTVHAAKGREFRHVVMLDGGDWRDPGDSERRVYYVGLTRARETLLLCQRQPGPNPFTPALIAEDLGGAILALPPVSLPPGATDGLDRRTLTLGLADVDLGFAGRHAPHHAVHERLAGLHHGQALAWQGDSQGLSFHLPDDSLTLGKTARRLKLPPGRIEAITVETLVWRRREQGDPAFAERIKTERWLVLLVNVVIDSGGDS